MSNAIEVRGLTYRAGRSFSLSDVSLTVPSGSIYGFLGPNGAGKTTTVRLLLGMMRRATGEVRLLDHAIPDDLPAALAVTGYVPERPHVYPSLRVDEALRFHAAFHTRWDAVWAARMQRTFELPGDRRVGRLSKGEAGKLMMLLALAQRPELLILDEPTDGLDPMVRRDVLTALLDYVGDTGATVFISSHLVHELERMCDWVGVLDHGRMIAEMPIDVLKGGVKRIRLTAPAMHGHAAPVELLNGHQAPFEILSRVNDPLTSGESWVVRGWTDPMKSYFDTVGATVRDVVDLDLEEVFVELLRSGREAKS
ncbi:MAG: ABC transporter ATP-binding protein [Gemmatimonadetes bacterium]|nr:ABC transporter ATP-binding protein [Gemmatimonadota bacterium]